MSAPLCPKCNERPRALYRRGVYRYCRECMREYWRMWKAGNSPPQRNILHELADAYRPKS